MSRDVYRRDQICYLDERNRQGTAARLIRSAYLLYKRSDFSKQGPQLDFDTWYFSYDVISDLSRVASSFENYIKAQMLLAGYVVHQIKGHSWDRKPLMTIAELNSTHPFVYDEEAGRNSIPAMTDKTFGFDFALKQAVLAGLPDEIVVVLDDQRRLRNSLHFTEAEPRNFEGEHLKLLTSFVDAQFKAALQGLAREMQLSNILAGLDIPYEA